MFKTNNNYMKKRLQKSGEEIVPLSSRQSLIVLVLIACVFQFLLFFTPALAAETVAAQENDISLGSLNKSVIMDENAQKIANTISTSTEIPGISLFNFLTVW